MMCGNLRDPASLSAGACARMNVAELFEHLLYTSNQMPTKSQLIRSIALLLTASPFAAGGQSLSPAGGQSLSPAERKMRSYVEQHVAEQIAFLGRVVDIGSGTMNHAGVR